MSDENEKTILIDATQIDATPTDATQTEKEEVTNPSTTPIITIITKDDNRLVAKRGELILVYNGPGSLKQNTDTVSIDIPGFIKGQATGVLTLSIDHPATS